MESIIAPFVGARTEDLPVRCKKLSVGVVFLCIAMVSASGSVTVPVSRGSIDVFGADLGYVFQFSAPGYHVTNLDSDGWGGYSNFTGGITFTDLYHDSFLFVAAPEGGLILNGQQFQWSGELQFTAMSFNYRFDPSGNLTVSGITVPVGSFVTPCDPINCITVEGPTFQITGQWRYVAHFVPNPDQTGYYDFTDLHIFSPLRFIQ
jgi:hypothetical protein